MLRERASFLAYFALVASPLCSEAPVCHHCEEIRLYNAEHHKNYEYFDEYVADEHKQEESSLPKDKKIAEK